MSVYDLKPAFQNVLRPLCRALAGAGVRPNAITIAALALSVVAGAAIHETCGAAWTLLALPAVLFVRMALNAVDGMLAREHGMRTPLGGLLNEVGDVLSDAALYLPLAVVPGVPPRAMAIVVVLAVVSEMTGVVAVQLGASRRYDGPMGKSDRALAFSVIALLLGLGVRPGAWLRITLDVIVLLLGVTVWRRAANALKEVRT